MRRSRLLPLVLAVLLLSAGCAADPATDAAPADPETTAAPTYPPGVTAAGVNASAVADAHRAALNDVGFVLSMAVEQSVGDESMNVSAAYRVGADRENVSIRLDTPFAGQRVYLTGDARYDRVESGDETRYAVRERSAEMGRSLLNSSSGASLVNETLSLGDYSVAGTETRNGTTYTTLTATGIADDADASAFADASANVTSFDSTVVVDGDGVVRSVSYAVVMERDGGSMTTVLSMDVSDVGSTTVTAPDWIDEAEASA